MNLSELTPDTALATLLDGKVEVQISATKKYPIHAYEQAQQPQTPENPEQVTVTGKQESANEFINAQWNGSVRSRSERLGIYQGAIALTIYCRLQSDNTAKKKRIASIIEQVQKLVHRKRSQGFFFTFNPMNVITPTTPNLTNGYSTTILNVEWHT